MLEIVGFEKDSLLEKKKNKREYDLEPIGMDHEIDIGAPVAVKSATAANNSRRLKDRSILNDIYDPTGPTSNKASVKINDANIENRNFNPFADPKTRRKLVAAEPPSFLWLSSLPRDQAVLY
ncbi:hypothetical protein WAI453_005156 [Rhynchosporium graminicola]